MVDVPERFTEHDRDALRLKVAFYCILEPDKRGQVVALAEMNASKDGAPVDGHSPQVSP